MIEVGAGTLRAWPLPEPGDSKYSRGEVVVIGGAARSPGAAMLASVAALRVGAGRLTMGVGESVAPAIGVAIPESGVVALEEEDGHIRGRGIRALADDLANADAVLVGPGLDDAGHAEDLVRSLVGLVSDRAIVVLDAYALGVLPRLERALKDLRSRLVLTPNQQEASMLLDRDLGDLDDDVARIAAGHQAVVTCFGSIASPDGRQWRVGTGNAGLATSGSGDVLAGAIAGLCARGATPAQAAVWATWLHAEAGQQLAKTVAPIGYLASELLDVLPALIARVEGE